MKKIAFFIVGLVMATTLCACSCSNMTPDTTTAPTTVPTTAPTTTPTTAPTIMPTDEVTVPVPETNIPDSTVDGNSVGRMRRK